MPSLDCEQQIKVADLLCYKPTEYLQNVKRN
ncbi:hypothetical protein LSH36_348g02041 [Paralvinella palmiformis]|uniref:Uncharacterized protein n=1 Tax=Paralvinella palmiformis TaxID=53620 RepID=A0AAD9N2I8_9ANNE|nr:hypothetical protein LSH36_348g02041 [Paralvinella palmiformis]